MNLIGYDGQIELEEDDWIAADESVAEGEEAFFPGDLVGKTAEEAAAYVAPFGYCVRATLVNGHPAIVTRDLKPNRINVALVYGKITDVLSVG